MHRCTIVVPSALIAPVRDGLRALYEIRTEDHPGRADTFGPSLTAIEEALGQLPGPGTSSRPTALAGDRDVLATAIHAALLTAAEHVVRTSHDFVLPDGELSPITGALAQAVEAHDLLAGLPPAA